MVSNFAALCCARDANVLEELARENTERVALALSGAKRDSAPQRRDVLLRALSNMMSPFRRRGRRRRGV